MHVEHIQRATPRALVVLVDLVQPPWQKSHVAVRTAVGVGAKVVAPAVPRRIHVRGPTREGRAEYLRGRVDVLDRRRVLDELGQHVIVAGLDRVHIRVRHGPQVRLIVDNVRADAAGVGLPEAPHQMIHPLVLIDDLGARVWRIGKGCALARDRPNTGGGTIQCRVIPSNGIGPR